MAAGVVFQVLTLLQPPLPVGVLCTLGLLFFARPGTTGAAPQLRTQLEHSP
jgi:hypothetical protein